MAKWPKGRKQGTKSTEVYHFTLSEWCGEFFVWSLVLNSHTGVHIRLLLLSLHVGRQHVVNKDGHNEVEDANGDKHEYQYVPANPAPFDQHSGGREAGDPSHPTKECETCTKTM
eukprot:6434139-Amphidinium_carterae.1